MTWSPPESIVRSNSPARSKLLVIVRCPPAATMTPGWIVIVWFGVTSPVVVLIVKPCDLLRGARGVDLELEVDREAEVLECGVGRQARLEDAVEALRSPAGDERQLAVDIDRAERSERGAAGDGDGRARRVGREVERCR